MTWLYNMGISLYRFGIGVASLSNSKAKKWIAGRKNLLVHIERSVTGTENPIWFHCASLGEFEQGKPVIEAIMNRHPGHQLVVTFFSPSGYDVRKDYELADHVFYLPLDKKRNATRFLNAVKPKMAVFVKYEFWYHFLSQLQQRQIPTFAISAHFRKDQHYFKWFGKKQLEVLKKLNHIFVQDPNSLQLLQQHGFNNASVSGDTRFDRVYDTAQAAEQLALVEEFKNGNKLFVAGSCWPPEEKLLGPFVNAKPMGMKFVYAPHDVSTNHVNQIMESISVPAIKYSEAKTGELDDYRVLVIDNIGLLARLYLHADIAFVGGGFDKGLHNILEPATFGMPVLFGPNHSTHPEAGELIEQGGAFVVSTTLELTDRIKFLESDPMLWQMASHMSQNYILKNRGATETIMKTLTSYLN